MCRHIHVYDWNIVACDVKQQIHLTSSILDNIMLFFFFEKKGMIQIFNDISSASFYPSLRNLFALTDLEGGGGWKSTPPFLVSFGYPCHGHADIAHLQVMYSSDTAPSLLWSFRESRTVCLNLIICTSETVDSEFCRFKVGCIEDLRGISAILRLGSRR